MQRSVAAAGLGLVSPLLASIRVGAQPAPPTGGSAHPDVGMASVQDGKVVVSVGPTAPAWVRVRYWPRTRPSQVVTTAWVRTNEATFARLVLSRADHTTDDVAWQADVLDATRTPGRDAGLIEPDRVRTVRRWPVAGAPEAVTVAGGSCTDPQLPLPAFLVAADAAPHLFSQYGDLGYADSIEIKHRPGLTGYPLYVDVLRRWMRHADAQRLLGSTAVVGCNPDDHGYGLLTSPQGEVKDYAAKAFADVVPDFGWPGPTYGRVDLGPVSVFHLDSRRYRGAGAALGTEQGSWLRDGLASSTAKVKVVMTPLTPSWSWAGELRHDYLPFIDAHVGGTVVWMSGDKHAGAVLRVPTARAPVYELLAAPMANGVKHYCQPFPKGYDPEVLYVENGIGTASASNPRDVGQALWNVLGRIDVDPAGATTLRLVRDDGVELHRTVVPPRG